MKTIIFGCVRWYFNVFGGVLLCSVVKRPTDKNMWLMQIMNGISVFQNNENRCRIKLKKDVYNCRELNSYIFTGLL